MKTETWIVQTSNLILPEIAVINEDDGTTVADIGEFNEVNMQRAKLISAAPDLLQNLKRIIDRIEENGLQINFPSAYDRAKEAIKKATS